jgi:hypothetical protein
MLEHPSIIKQRKRQNRIATMELPFPIRSNASNIRFSREGKKKMNCPSKLKLSTPGGLSPCFSSSLSLSLSLIWIFGTHHHYFMRRDRVKERYYFSGSEDCGHLLDSACSVPWCWDSGQSPHKGPSKGLLIKYFDISAASFKRAFQFYSTAGYGDDVTAKPEHD